MLGKTLEQILRELMNRELSQGAADGISTQRSVKIFTFWEIKSRQIIHDKWNRLGDHYKTERSRIISE